jgi:hypothetical protein
MPMRRLTLSLALLALTGTLIAQTPQSMPLTKPDKFHCKVSWSTQQQDGDTLRLKNATLEFEMGVTITADEAVFDKANGDVLQLSGNVQMNLKH